MSTELGGAPTRINPLIPTELVIDHSVIADVFGRPPWTAPNGAWRTERTDDLCGAADRFPIRGWS